MELSGTPDPRIRQHAIWVNIGNLHYGPGKEQVCEHIALGPEDRSCLKYFAEHGVEIDYRCVPKATAKVNL